MADTIVTNSPRSNDSGAGWAVAFILLLVVMIGGVVLYQRGFFNSVEAPAGTNINVTIPNPVAPSAETKPTTP